MIHINYANWRIDVNEKYFLYMNIIIGIFVFLGTIRESSVIDVSADTSIMSANKSIRSTRRTRRSKILQSVISTIYVTG